MGGRRFASWVPVLAAGILSACTLLVDASGLTSDTADASVRDAGETDGSQNAQDAEAAPDDGAAREGAPDDPYVLAVLADKPLFYFRLDETDRTLGARDRARTHHGLYVGNVVLGDPGPVKSGTSVRFDGTSTAVLMGEPIAAFEGKAPYTFEAWIMPTTATGYRRVVGRHDGVDGVGLFLSDLSLASRRQSETCNGPTLLNSAFQHAVVTFDGTTTLFYVNGLKRSPSDCTTAPPVVAPSGQFGLGGGDGDFAGNLDEVAVYDFALSAERAQAHFAASGR